MQLCVRSKAKARTDSTSVSNVMATEIRTDLVPINPGPGERVVIVRRFKPEKRRWEYASLVTFNKPHIVRLALQFLTKRGWQVFSDAEF